MKIDKSKLMKKAWEIARTAMKTFGGKVREYFDKSLKTAWNFMRNAIDVDALKKIGREWKKDGHHRIYFNNITGYMNTEGLRRWKTKMIDRDGILYYEVEKKSWFCNCHVDDYFDEIKANILALI